TAQNALLEARNQLTAVEATNTLGMRAKVFADVLTAEVNLCNRSNQLSVAQAELDAIGARIAADEARFSSSRSSRGEETEKSEIRSPKSEIDERLLTSAGANELAASASRAERLLELRQAEARLAEAESTLALLQAEQSIGAARRSAESAGEKKEDQAKADATLKKVQEQCATAGKGVETAQAALQTNSTAYTPLSPVYPGQSTGRRRALAGW